MLPSLAKGSVQRISHGNCLIGIEISTIILGDLISSRLVLVEIVLPIKATLVLHITVESYSST